MESDDDHTLIGRWLPWELTLIPRRAALAAVLRTAPLGSCREKDKRKVSQ